MLFSHLCLGSNGFSLLSLGVTFGTADGDLETTFFVAAVLDGPRDIADECRYERREERSVLHPRAVHSAKNAGGGARDRTNPLFSHKLARSVLPFVPAAKSAGLTAVTVIIPGKSGSEILPVSYPGLADWDSLQ